MLFGGAVGLEREIKGKPAGLRTNILICVGSALFTHLSVVMVATQGDPSRIAAQIVTGVGFIGAGTILRERGSISGLTSAATIWVVAAVGVAVGAGAIYEAGGATLLLVLVLAGMGKVEAYAHRRSVVSQLTVEVERDDAAEERLEALIRQKGLDIEEVRSEITGEDRMRLHVTMRGPQRLHDRARLSLLRMTGSHKLSIEE